MSNDNKARLKARDKAHNRKQTDKLSSLIESVILTAIVLIICLCFVSSLTTCQQNNKQVADKIQHNKEHK